jgi:hypothetical protein
MPMDQSDGPCGVCSLFPQQRGQLAEGRVERGESGALTG